MAASLYLKTNLPSLCLFTHSKGKTDDWNIWTILSRNKGVSKNPLAMNNPVVGAQKRDERDDARTIHICHSLRSRDYDNCRFPASLPSIRETREGGRETAAAALLALGFNSHDDRDVEWSGISCCSLPPLTESRKIKGAEMFNKVKGDRSKFETFLWVRSVESVLKTIFARGVLLPHNLYVTKT